MVPSEDIEKRFTHHVPNEEKIRRHESLRTECKNLAFNLNSVLPDGREKSLALTHLEEVLMWSNAAIAREGN